jgi:hypothetical protein
MYLYVYMYLHIFTYLYMFIFIYAYVSTYINVYTYMWMQSIEHLDFERCVFYEVKQTLGKNSKKNQTTEIWYIKYF